MFPRDRRGSPYRSVSDAGLVWTSLRSHAGLCPEPCHYACSYVATKLIMHAKSLQPSQMCYIPLQYLCNRTTCMLKQKLTGSPTFLARIFGSVPVFYGSAYAVSSSIFNIPTLAYILMTWRRSSYSANCWTTRETSCFPYRLNHYIFTSNNMHLFKTWRRMVSAFGAAIFCTHKRRDNGQF